MKTVRDFDVFPYLKLYITILLISLTLNCDAQDNIGKDVIKNISPLEFQNLIEKKEGYLIDIRTKDEYESGHIENARNMDYYQGDFQSRLDSLDKSIPVLIYCRTGNRSFTAANIMESMGFTNIYNLKDGIVAWEEANLELITKK